MTSSPARSITAPSAAPVLNSICVLPPSGSDPTKKNKNKNPPQLMTSFILSSRQRHRGSGTSNSAACTAQHFPQSGEVTLL